MRQMRVLIACEHSAIMRDAFIGQGFYAMSCDLRPTDSKLGPHYQGDVRDVLHWEWNLMVAHPTCTYLCNSGVRWLHTQPGRSELMVEGAEFFNTLRNAPIKHKAIENPIPHKYAVERIGKYSQIVQPWQFGHGETKATCFWLENLPLLVPTNIVVGREHRIHRLPPGPNRSKIRSITYPGIARAGAVQWGAYIKSVACQTSANTQRAT